MLMTAEIKWKFEGKKKSVICRTWLKMVLSRNDLKAQATKKNKKNKIYSQWQPPFPNVA